MKSAIDLAMMNCYKNKGKDLPKNRASVADRSGRPTAPVRKRHPDGLALMGVYVWRESAGSNPSPDPCGPAPVIGTNAALVTLAFGVRCPTEVVSGAVNVALSLPDVKRRQQL